jgi:hypothetical protein|tara:strand:- start:116 stop:631 length:516 start_codon:yes stop_codon:yes gene_type:complete
MELKELVYEGHLVPGYYINTNGELYSTRLSGVNQWNRHIKQIVCYGGNMKKLLGTKVGRGKKYTMYKIGKIYTHREHITNYGQFGILAHRAVMETFSPFEDNLPDDLIDEWPNLSTTVKRYIIEGWTVDHKEDLDENYDSLSNLQWMTRSDNASKGNRKVETTLLEKILWN